MMLFCTALRKCRWLAAIACVAATAGSFALAADPSPATPVLPGAASLRLAITDLTHEFGAKYPKGQQFADRLADLEFKAANATPATLASIRDSYAQLQREALLANPLIDFDNLLLIRRGDKNLGLPQNWQGNSSLRGEYNNDIAILPIKLANPALQSLYKPQKNVFVGNVTLHFDADKMLFSSIGTNNRWQVFEIKADGAALRQVSVGEYKDIDNYEPIYLPDDRIMYDSSSGFVGVPCVGGSDAVANLHIMNPDGTGIRRLCFEQDLNWCPTMLPDGRVLYLRWEYTDSAHYFSRVLMSMNPDGTNQTAFYGSNSYWPNAMFYAKPIPGSSTKFVAVVSGHHGPARMGELVLFDAARGRETNAGVIQRIPGYGKPVQAVIADGLVNNSWPKFLHPYPLSDKYFIVSAKPKSNSLWGIYLVDIFDNMLLLKEEPACALLEPIALRKTPRPPVTVSTVKPDEKTATVYIHDIYAGKGLAGVPRGTVKNIRVLQYEFSYRNMGGHYEIGIESGWDVRRLVGTVPVYTDGSAMFKIPANTPVALQPLDSEGKALQQMRSWFVGMPGEYVSCVGCHEQQNSTAAPRAAQAARSAPSVPADFYGPKRGFSFIREVQPVLDQSCVGCHNGQPDRPNFADSTIAPTGRGMRSFPKSYVELHPYVRRNGPEGDYSLLTPLEFHADTSPLVQILKKGHYNVRLDAEAWDRLYTWIDLNVPAHGTWHEVKPIPKDFEKRRYEMKKLYAGVDEDIEAIPPVSTTPVIFIKPAPMLARPQPIKVDGWPLSDLKARELQTALGQNDLKIDLGNQTTMTLKRIPAGDFAMGDVNGYPDEYPQTKVKIAKSFWMAATEVSLKQYQQFKPEHRNGYYDMHFKDQVRPGYLMDSPDFPAIRVSWDQANAYCQWLSAKTGKKFSLPTEAQWEWACRAGTDTPMFYGDLNSDFGPYANLADVTTKEMAVTGVNPQPIKDPDKYWDFVLKDGRLNDGVLHLAKVGHYKPNAWGLDDMIGNVAEWTRSEYRPYPYDPAKESSAVSVAGQKVVRGGSWADRPKDARAGFRWAYPQWQRPYNVGLRVICED